MVSSSARVLEWLAIAGARPAAQIRILMRLALETGGIGAA
jgi:hypothetical protein